MKSNLINLILRFSSLAGKFVLVFVIAKFLDLKELGIYGILNTTVTLGVFLIGLEFYNFSTREFINNKDQLGKLVRDQFVFHLISYIISTPLVYLIFFFDILPLEYYLLFTFVLILEHLNQEIYRILVAFSKLVEANIALFIRSSIWILFLYFLWVYSDVRNLEQLLTFWSIGGLLALFLGLFWMKKFHFVEIKFGKINFSWIKKGLITSIPFLVASLSYKFVEYSDRYFIDYFFDKDSVGVYTFYSGLSKVIQIAIFTVVTMVYYPKMIDSYGKDQKRFQYYISKSLKETILYALAITVALIVSIDTILAIFDKPQLTEYKELLYILILGQVILCFSYIPHYILYAKKKDQTIMYSTLLGAGLCLVLSIILVPKYGPMGSAISGTIGYVAILAIKMYGANYGR